MLLLAYVIYQVAIIIVKKVDFWCLEVVDLVKMLPSVILFIPFSTAVLNYEL